MSIKEMIFWLTIHILSIFGGVALAFWVFNNVLVKLL